MNQKENLSQYRTEATRAIHILDFCVSWIPSLVIWASQKGGQKQQPKSKNNKKIQWFMMTREMVNKMQMKNSSDAK